MADDDTPAERRDTTERRVYTLPANLLERLRAYQVGQGIASEAEAARRLLDTALQLRDNVTDILKTLQAKFAEEKDLRVLASEVVAKHALVTKVIINEGAIEFYLRDGDRGMLGHRGALFIASASDDDNDWAEWPPKPRKRVTPTPSWDPPGGADLDDEIPF